MAFGQMTARDGLIATAVFSSFIVTTAELFMLKANVNVHAVEHSTTLADVAEPIDALELLTFPSDELREHNRAALAASRNWSSEDLSDPRVRRFFDYWEPIASELENVSPSVFVVKLGALSQLLRAQSRFVERASLESAREAAARRGTPHWA